MSTGAIQPANRLPGSPVVRDVTMAMNPLKFIDEVRQEVSKVTWPTPKEVWITTIMVLIMVAITSIFFMIADLTIGSLVQWVLSLGR
jgi:preprotein translocase subunit SecE